MSCTRCDSQLRPGSIFCPQCGAPTREDTSGRRHPSGPPSARRPGPTRGSRRRATTVIVIVAFVLLVVSAAGVAAGYVAADRNPTMSGSAATGTTTDSRDTTSGATLATNGTANQVVVTTSGQAATTAETGTASSPVSPDPLDTTGRPPVLCVAPFAKSMLLGDSLQVTTLLKSGPGPYTATKSNLTNGNKAILSVAGMTVNATGTGSTSVDVSASGLTVKLQFEVFRDAEARESGLEGLGPAIEAPIYCDGRVELLAWPVVDDTASGRYRISGSIRNKTDAKMSLTTDLFRLLVSEDGALPPERESTFFEPVENGTSAGSWVAEAGEDVGFSLYFSLPLDRQNDAEWLVFDDGDSRIIAAATGALPATSTSTATSGNETSLSLPVKILDTSLGETGTKFGYPTTVSVSVPAEWKGQLAAYGVAGAVILAPVGWTSDDAAVGAGGSARATLHSTNSSSIAGEIIFEQTSASVGDAWDRSAQYFPWVRENWKDSPFPDSPVPNPRAGLEEYFLNDQHVTYSIANTGPNETNGVAHTYLVAGSSYLDEYPGFDRLEVALSSKYRELATVILNYYLAHEFEYHVGP
jgi:hypothetical protein